MGYTTKERNEAIMNIASGKADLKNTTLYENLETFKWINISRRNGAIDNVELTYSGKDLNRRLLKNIP